MWKCEWARMKFMQKLIEKYISCRLLIEWCNSLHKNMYNTKEKNSAHKKIFHIQKPNKRQCSDGMVAKKKLNRLWNMKLKREWEERMDRNGIERRQRVLRWKWNVFQVFTIIQSERCIERTINRSLSYLSFLISCVVIWCVYFSHNMMKYLNMMALLYFPSGDVK
jgi:hypothetical protein